MTLQELRDRIHEAYERQAEFTDEFVAKVLKIVNEEQLRIALEELCPVQKGKEE